MKSQSGGMQQVMHSGKRRLLRLEFRINTKGSFPGSGERERGEAREHENKEARRQGKARGNEARRSMKKTRWAAELGHHARKVTVRKALLQFDELADVSAGSPVETSTAFVAITL